MPVHGPLHHIDMTVSDPDRAIPFWGALLEALGFRRWVPKMPEFQGEAPRRATWNLVYPDGAFFGIEVRPAEPGSREAPVDRYAPGLHHMAFHAESREAVDRVHEAVRAVGGTVLDPPADYGGHPAYAEGYYAVFFADPDGVKLEVVHLPITNPG